MLIHTFLTLTLFEYSPDTKKSCATFLNQINTERNRLQTIVFTQHDFTKCFWAHVGISWYDRASQSGEPRLILVPEQDFRGWPFNTQSWYYLLLPNNLITCGMFQKCSFFLHYKSSPIICCACPDLKLAAIKFRSNIHKNLWSWWGKTWNIFSLYCFQGSIPTKDNQMLTFCYICMFDRAPWLFWIRVVLDNHMWTLCVALLSPENGCFSPPDLTLFSTLNFTNTHGWSSTACRWELQPGQQ